MRDESEEVKKGLLERRYKCDEKYERFQNAVEKLDKDAEQKEFAELKALAGEIKESMKFWERFAESCLEV